MTQLRAVAASAAGKWLDGVEQSLLYCRRHPLGDNGQALFNLPPPPGKKQQQQRGEVQQYRLIRRDLLKAALLHYAKQHRHLDLSRKLLAKVRRGLCWDGLGWARLGWTLYWHGMTCLALQPVACMSHA